MKKIFTLIATCLIVASGLAQTTGYLGKRFFVSISESVQPDFRGIDESYYKDTKVDIPFLQLRFPLSFDINFVLCNAVSIGAGASFVNVSGNFEGAYVNDPNNYDPIYYFSAVNYKTKLFNLYLEGHKRFSYSVIDNYFRCGVAIASFSNTSYSNTFIQTYGYWNYDDTFLETEIPDEYVALRLNQKSSLNGLYYEFGNRIPAGNHLLLYYGVSGYLFPIRNRNYKDFGSTSFENDKEDTFIIDLGKKRVSNGNMFRMNFGLTWAF